MDSLGDPEKLVITSDRQPAGIHPCPARISQQRLQHLRHTPAAGGGVDVPDDTPGQDLMGGPRRFLDFSVHLPQQGPKAFWRGRSDGDVGDCSHAVHTKRILIKAL